MECFHCQVSGRRGPEFQALTLLAKYLQNPANKEAVMPKVNEVSFTAYLLGGGHRYLDTWIPKICQVSKKIGIQEYPRLRVSKSIQKSQTSSSMSPKCQEVWRKNMFFLDTWIPKICQVSKKIGIQEYP